MESLSETRLDKLQPPDVSPIDWRGGRLFYTKRMPGETDSKLYYREGGWSGAERSNCSLTRLLTSKGKRFPSKKPYRVGTARWLTSLRLWQCGLTGFEAR